MDQVYTNYQIDWSDPSKTGFAVPPGAVDTTSTSLTIFGFGYQNWGEKLQENILRVMENFSSPSAPLAPTTGQIWFDSTSNTLQIWFDNQWNPIFSAGGIVVSTTEPINVYSGMVWYDPNVSRLQVRIATSWHQILTDVDTTTLDNRYISRSAPVLGANLDANNHAINNVSPPLSSRDVATKEYVDDNFISRSGDAMVGFLELQRQPVTAMHAANKGYIDNLITAMLTNNSGTIPSGVDSHSEIVTIPGKQIFAFPFTYTQNDNSLMVFVNGVKQQLGSAYSETGPSTVTLAVGLAVNDVFEAISIKQNTGGATFLSTAGGVIAGDLNVVGHVIVSDPQTYYHVANKQYVDTKVEQLQLEMVGSKVGHLMPFAGNILPTGYIWANGASVTRADFPQLFGEIGQRYDKAVTVTDADPTLYNCDDHGFITGEMITFMTYDVDGNPLPSNMPVGLHADSIYVVRVISDGTFRVYTNLNDANNDLNRISVTTWGPNLVTVARNSRFSLPNMTPIQTIKWTIKADARP
jgi:hypothetical protein